MGGYAYSDDSGSGIVGAGTPPQLAYFSGANQISSTPHAEHGTNDIIFKNGVAFKVVTSAVNYNVLPTDTYIGAILRLAPVTFTLPLLADVQDGHIFMVAEETAQIAFPVTVATQMGQIIREGGLNNTSIVTFLPHQTFKIIKRTNYYMVIGD